MGFEIICIGINLLFMADLFLIQNLNSINNFIQMNMHARQQATSHLFFGICLLEVPHFDNPILYPCLKKIFKLDIVVDTR